jgi:hypothetical protein
MFVDFGLQLGLINAFTLKDSGSQAGVFAHYGQQDMFRTDILLLVITGYLVGPFNDFVDVRAELFHRGILCIE